MAASSLAAWGYTLSSAMCSVRTAALSVYGEDDSSAHLDIELSHQDDLNFFREVHWLGNVSRMHPMKTRGPHTLSSSAKAGTRLNWWCILFIALRCFWEAGQWSVLQESRYSEARRTIGYHGASKEGGTNAILISCCFCWGYRRRTNSTLSSSAGLVNAVEVEKMIEKRNWI